MLGARMKKRGKGGPGLSQLTFPFEQMLLVFFQILALRGGCVNG